MKPYPFASGEKYKVSEMVAVLTERLESGIGITDIEGKKPLIELFKRSAEEFAVFTPSASTWGLSPFNPNAWKKEDGTDLIAGYRQARTLRSSPSKGDRQLIFNKTGGLCHICGGELDPGWAADHVMPAAAGGKSMVDNFLPACYVCNGLRWNRSPKVIQEIMQLGIYARREIQHDTPLGRQMKSLLQKRVRTNLSRRKPRKQPAESTLPAKLMNGGVDEGS